MCGRKRSRCCRHPLPSRTHAPLLLWCPVRTGSRKNIITSCKKILSCSALTWNSISLSLKEKEIPEGLKNVCQCLPQVSEEGRFGILTELSREERPGLRRDLVGGLCRCDCTPLLHGGTQETPPSQQCCEGQTWVALWEGDQGCSCPKREAKVIKKQKGRGKNNEWMKMTWYINTTE